MSGDSTTALGSASGGDNVYDEVLGSGTKEPASKLHTGALGVDGGPVAAGNPLPVQGYDGAGVGVFPAAAAAGDAEANATTVSRVLARLAAFNGSTWDRVRAGLTTISSTFTGILNGLPFALYHTTRTTRTNGQGGPVESRARGDASFAPGAIATLAFTASGTGALVASGACFAYSAVITNTFGGTIWVMLFDSLTQPIDGTVPLQSAALTNSAVTTVTFGSPAYGLKLTNGLWLQFSSVSSSLSSFASDPSITGYITHSP